MNPLEGRFRRERMGSRVDEHRSPNMHTSGAAREERVCTQSQDNPHSTPQNRPGDGEFGTPLSTPAVFVTRSGRGIGGRVYA